MNLVEAMNIKKGEVVSLVGGGGKTSLMFALAYGLTENGKKVITTTTTRIEEPSAGQTQKLIVEADEEKMLGLTGQYLKSFGHITIARERLPDDKLKGISPGLVDRLAVASIAHCVIVEADGAGGRPLKAPIAREPVIPASTSLVIPVVGVEAVGCLLTEELVFRVDSVAGLLGLAYGAVITAKHVAILATHPEGLTKGSPPQARIIPFINKMDMEGALLKGRELAEEVFKFRHPQIDRVVLGQVRATIPIKEVVFN
ncbi:selenium cofactor biosynthesis protein YqeC [Chloroflexota bacterium]